MITALISTVAGLISGTIPNLLVKCCYYGVNINTSVVLLWCI